jgi:hypothetical protein
MALRRILDAEAAEDREPLPEATLPTVLTVGGEPRTVTVAEAPAGESHSGACTCGACSAATLADLAIHFRS